MKKGLIFLTSAMFLVLMATFAMAHSGHHYQRDSKWSLRGEIHEHNIIGDISWFDWIWLKRTKVNANFRNGRAGFDSAGELELQAANLYGERIRFSLNWDADGDEYAVWLVEDNEFETILEALARVNIDGDHEYWVPVEIRYDKDLHQLNIWGPDFAFENVWVKDYLHKDHIGSKHRTQHRHPWDSRYEWPQHRHPDRDTEER